jgi:hypothetical protein
MKNSTFDTLNFKAFGSVILLKHNAKETITLNVVNFKKIFGAGIRLEP